MPAGLLALRVSPVAVVSVMWSAVFATFTPAAAAQTRGDGSRAEAPAALPPTHTPRPTTAEISAEDLKTRLYIFADDSMQGRAAGTLGNVKGTDYLAAEAKRIGLQPMGDSGTYFQTVPKDGARYPMRNVIALLPGSDPALKHQYVVLGAHNDHLGMGRGGVDHDSIRAYNFFMRPKGVGDQVVEMVTGKSKVPTAEEWQQINTMLAKSRKQHSPRKDSVMNGADDDGSGSVALLEIAQALAAAPVRPKRSILFAWHTDEEGGKSGSEHLVNHPPVPLDSMVAELNVDMIGRGGASDLVGGGPRYLEVKKSGCLAATLDSLIRNVNQRGGFNFGLVPMRSADTVAGSILQYSSDDDSYGSKGISSAFFFTGVHSDYHQLTDEPQYIDYEHMTLVTKLIEASVADLANRERPVLCR